MAAVEHANRLPPEPNAYNSCRENHPNHYETYNRTLRTELHTTEQVEANPTNQEAQENIVPARVAGYFLIKLFDRRVALRRGPTQALQTRDP